MPDEPDDDLLLTGAEIADGTGAPLWPGDVLVERGRVRAVEPPGTLPRDRPARDLAGLVLAPGFIDVHSHADNAPLLAEDDTTKIRQGVTTEVVGNCGFSLAPRTSAHAETLASFLRRLFPPIEFRWSNFAELFSVLDDAGHVTNYCPLVGHGTLRIAALGMSDETADPAAMRVMREALDKGMAAGAFGLSSGLIYPPALSSSTEELRSLAEVLGGDGLYATHMRDEGAGLLDSIDEALRIGATAGRTHISHLKASGQQNWGKIPAALDRLRTAREAGQPVCHDVYPYTASSTMLVTVLPPEWLTGDADQLLARLSRRDSPDALEAALGEQDFSRVLVATTASHECEGRTIAEIAEAEGTSGVEALVRILRDERLQASMIQFSMLEDDLEHALADERTVIGSDGLPPGTGGKPHPPPVRHVPARARPIRARTRAVRPARSGAPDDRAAGAAVPHPRTRLPRAGLPGGPGGLRSPNDHRRRRLRRPGPPAAGSSLGLPGRAHRRRRGRPPRSPRRSSTHSRRVSAGCRAIPRTPSRRSRALRPPVTTGARCRRSSP